MKYQIPYALMLATKNPDGSLQQGVDGFNNPTDGLKEPLFDTLLGVYNPSSKFPAVFTVDCYDRQGQLLKWPEGGGMGRWTLQPGHSVATTFIEGNVWQKPLQNWIGYIEITSDRPIAINCILGGGGLYPKHWNIYSATVPVYSDIQPQSKFMYPYVIPHFSDANHGPVAAQKLNLQDFSYSAGLVMTNFSRLQNVFVHGRYVVGDIYPAAGSVYTFVKELKARNSFGLDLHNELLVPAGYPAGMNSEGALELILREAADPKSLPVYALVVPYLINQNNGYDSFSAGAIYC